MTANKKIRETAASLLHLSLKEEEVSSERVSAILQTLEARPPRKYKAVLREFLRLVRKQIERTEARVEHAGALSPNLLSSIEASLSSHYGRPITAIPKENQDLIAGWRIYIGSDVYDSSIQNHLNLMARATTTR